MVPERKYREIVFQLLYALDQGTGETQELIPLLMRECKAPKRVVTDAYTRACAVAEQRTELDAFIAAHARSYALERIGKPEQSVLRLALFEREEGKLPREIVISEAVRLTRKFCTPEAASFVNAVLDDDASLSA